MEMELIGTSFSIAGRLTAFPIIRIIRNVQVGSVTGQKLKSIIGLHGRKSLCKMIKQVMHSIWKKLCPLLMESGKRRISAGSLCWKKSWDVVEREPPCMVKRERIISRKEILRFLEKSTPGRRDKRILLKF